MSKMSEARPLFYEEVEGVGRFGFRRRTMRDEFRVEAIYSDLTGGVATPTEVLDFYARAFAILKVLIESAPDGWDLESLDPFEPNSYEKLQKVYSALRGAEERFRGGSGKGGQVVGPEARGDAESVVSPPI